MTKIYSAPLVEVHPLHPLSMICASGTSKNISSNVGVGGGDKSGDVADAF